MTESSHYVIRGGLEGRERLCLLGRVMWPSSMALFDRVDVRPGWSCLDAGCGGGGVSFELARLVGPTGTVAGVDMDEEKLQIARTEAAQQNLANVSFRCANVCQPFDSSGFDFVYSRFLLTHLSDPASAVGEFRRQLQPGGMTDQSGDDGEHRWRGSVRWSGVVAGDRRDRARSVYGRSEPGHGGWSAANHPGVATPSFQYVIPAMIGS